MGSLPDSKYIIQTDGYYFVESHDVDPSKGYITVSAKGIVNGLSNIPNDGADFGPDSYNPSYSGSGIPYTSTSGIQEGLDYVKAQNGGTLRIFTGVYTINTAIAYSIDDPSQGGISIIGAQINEETNAIGGVRIEPGDNFTSGAYLMTFGKDTTVQLNVDIENLYFYGGKNGSTSAFASGINLQNIGTFYSKNLTFSYCVVGKYLQEHSNIGIINGVTNIQDVFNYCNTGIINEYTSSFYTPQFFNCVLPIQEQGLLGTAYYSPTLLGTSGTTLVELASSNNLSLYIYNMVVNGMVSGATVFGINNNAHQWLHVYGLYTKDDGITIFKELTYGNNFFAVVSGYNYYGNNVTLIDISSNISGEIKFVDGYINGGITVTATYPIGNPVVKFSNVTNIDQITASISPNPPVSGTSYQNTNPYDILIYLPAYATTSGTAGSVAVAIGSTSSLSTTFTQFVSGSTSSSSPDTLQIKVPAGWYYEVTTTSVTLATATVVAD